MCICHMFHNHHRPPCTRPPSFSFTYVYCPSAVLSPTTHVPVSPCGAVLFDPDFSLLPGNPCAAGHCIASPQCEDGTCRLRDLGGVWACCRCGGRGNRMLSCRGRRKGGPDTFCYHDVCPGCKPDR